MQDLLELFHLFRRDGIRLVKTAAATLFQQCFHLFRRGQGTVGGAFRTASVKVDCTLRADRIAMAAVNAEFRLGDRGIARFIPDDRTAETISHAQSATAAFLFLKNDHNLFRTPIFLRSGPLPSGRSELVSFPHSDPDAGRTWCGLRRSPHPAARQGIFDPVSIGAGA